MDIDAKTNPNPDNPDITAKFNEYIALCERRASELSSRYSRIQELQAEIHLRAEAIRTAYSSAFLDG